MMMFPTIKKMAESPQGKRLTPILKYGRWFIVFVAGNWLASTILNSICISLGVENLN